MNLEVRFKHYRKTGNLFRDETSRRLVTGKALPYEKLDGP
jgi:hypothetical protein